MGNVNKKQKVSSERAHKILLDTLMYNKWEQKFDVTVSKIKGFFSMTPQKQIDSIESSEIPLEYMDEALTTILNTEKHCSELTNE